MYLRIANSFTMRTLNNHTILYDAECPMCNLYTRAFTTTGMLDPKGRAPYQDMPPFACPMVDRQRAVNEIALVDKTTGEVKYGIDSLFTIIAHSFPIFGPLFRWKPFIWLMRKFYAFISYNRKVIIPAPINGKTHSIQPSFRLRYRIAWLLFTAGVAGSILTNYTGLLKELLPTGSPYREYAIIAGLMIFQGLIAGGPAPRKKWDYLGNMMTVLLIGSLLLLPLMAIAAFTRLPVVIAAGYFLLVAGWMLLEYIRRIKLLSGIY